MPCGVVVVVALCLVVVVAGVVVVVAVVVCVVVVVGVLVEVGVLVVAGAVVVGGGGGLPPSATTPKSCTQKITPLLVAAAPSPVATNEPFSMFALWPAELSQAVTTDCASGNPSAMFSPQEAP